MRKQQKRIVLTSITICLTFFSAFSYAQEPTKNIDCTGTPPICSATPLSMNLYLDFQRQVTALIQNNPFESTTESAGKGKPGIFSEKLLDLSGGIHTPNTSIGQAFKISGLALWRSTSAIATSTFLFQLSALSVLGDNSAGLSILLQDRAIVRDRAKVLDVERTLNTTAYYIGKEGDLLKTIAQTQPLKDLLKSYEKKGLLINTESFASAIKYGDLLTELAGINLAVKEYLAYGSTRTLKSHNPNGIQFNPKWIETLKNDYFCVRKIPSFSCNISRKNIGKNMSIISNTTNEQGKNSLKKITTSRDNFKEAISVGRKNAFEGPDNTLTEREKELLRNIYGFDTQKMTLEEKRSIFSFGKRSKNLRKEQSQNITKTTKELREDTKDAWERIKQTGKAIGYVFTPASKVNKTIKNNANTSEESNENLDSFDIRTIFQLQNLEKARRAIENTATIGENSELTRKFGELSIAIKKTIDTINLDQGDRTGLRNTVKKICEYQCNNKNSSTCYIK